MAAEDLGFVGVGRMGGPMARRLLEAGHRLTIFDTSESAMLPLIAKGARRLLNMDVRLCLKEADAMGVPMIVGNAVRQLLNIAAATEGPQADITEVVKSVERWAGVGVGA